MDVAAIAEQPSDYASLVTVVNVDPSTAATGRAHGTLFTLMGDQRLIDPLPPLLLRPGLVVVVGVCGQSGVLVRHLVCRSTGLTARPQLVGPSVDREELSGRWLLRLTSGAGLCFASGCHGTRYVNDVAREPLKGWNDLLVEQVDDSVSRHDNGVVEVGDQVRVSETDTRSERDALVEVLSDSR